MRQWLAQACGAEPGNCSVRGPIAVRDNSVLFYAECDRLPSAALVKICLAPDTRQPDADAARSEYAGLLAVHRAMRSSQHLSVPRPYILQPDVGLLAIEWVPGKNIAKRLSSWICGRGSAESYVAQSAKWLKAFHACHRLPAAALDVDSKLSFIATIESSFPSSDEVFYAGVAQLRRSAGAAAAAKLPRSWIHGDFTPDNLIVSGERVLGIDTQLRHENAVVYDLAPFLNHLALALLEPSGWPLLRSHQALRRTFVATYLDGSAINLEIPLAWTQLYLALQHWHSARQRNFGALRRCFVDVSHRSLTRQLVHAFAETDPPKTNLGR